MSKIVPFPQARAGARPGEHLLGGLLGSPPAGAHLMQLYHDESFLLDTVGQFVTQGWLGGEAAFAIASSQRLDALVARLGPESVELATREGRLALVDADALLARVLVGGAPSPAAFELALSRVVGQLLPAGERRGLRAFAELTDVLWRRGLVSAALQLEALWSQACSSHGVALLCSYALGSFYRSDEMPEFGELCRLHTHAFPTERFTRNGPSDIERLRAICVLEQQARLLESEIQYRAELERALSELRAAPGRTPGAVPASDAGEAYTRRVGRLGALSARLIAPVLSRMVSALPLGLEPAERDEPHAIVRRRLRRAVERLLLSKADARGEAPVSPGDPAK